MDVKAWAQRTITNVAEKTSTMSASSFVRDVGKKLEIPGLDITGKKKLAPKEREAEELEENLEQTLALVRSVGDSGEEADALVKTDPHTGKPIPDPEKVSE